MNIFKLLREKQNYFEDLLNKWSFRSFAVLQYSMVQLKEHHHQLEKIAHLIFFLFIHIQVI